MRVCPACRSSSADIAGESGGFSVCSCHRCHTLFTALVPEGLEQEDYNRYYQEANFETPAFVTRVLDGVLGSFADVRQHNRLLDVGFGAGDLLHAAARAGWMPHGIEVSRPAWEHVRPFGYQVVHGTLEQARYPDAYFDVVTAVEVLEHVGDPEALLCEVRRILRPGGIFWATTPHARGLSGRFLGARWSVVSPPEHLQLFSVKGLVALLQRVGFSRVRIQTHGMNPFEILTAMRTTEASNPTKPFDRVGSSRRLNEFVSSGRFRLSIKAAVNRFLDITRTGDSLKVRAL